MEQVNVYVPRAVSGRMRRITFICSFFGIAGMFSPIVVLGYYMFTNALHEPSNGIQFAATTLAVGFSLVSVQFILNWLLLKNVSKIIADLSGLRGHPELQKLIRYRTGKTVFFYLSGKVPTTLQRIRISKTPNPDGTYWMMETDHKFSRMVLTRYRRGEIPEPSDPDSLAAKYPQEEMGWKVSR